MEIKGTVAVVVFVATGTMVAVAMIAECIVK